MIRDDHREIHLQAPAKVNLVLRILDRLPTGYHNLWSVMQTVDLVDHLHLRVNPNSSGINIHCSDPLVPKARTNLVYRAAELVRDHAGLRVGLEIELEKRIPMAAGLGGGSSDAAATIAGIVRLLELDWSSSKISQLGSQLGSDIPFFLSGSSALIRGWGQRISRVSIIGERWIVLVNPGFPIETRWAYQRLTASRKEVHPISDQLKEIETQQTLSWNQVVDLMENDFESALFPIFPALNQLKNDLFSVGAQAALLSGSGSTVFGVFPTEDAAHGAQCLLQAESQRQVFAVRARSTDLLQANTSLISTAVESESDHCP